MCHDKPLIPYRRCKMDKRIYQDYKANLMFGNAYGVLSRSLGTYSNYNLHRLKESTVAIGILRY